MAHRIFSAPSSRWQQRLKTHLFLVVASAAVFWLLYEASPVVYRWYTAEPRTLQHADDVLARVSLASAYLALLWLCLTLSIGAWNILRKGRSPLHLDIRRDVAIWAGTAGVIHGIVGVMVHYRGKGWFYYFLYPPSKPHDFPIRYDLFGFSNHTGLIAWLVCLLLLLLSSDLALRKVGAKRWKSLQRWNYTLFGFVALHSVLYQIVERRPFPFVLLFAVLVAWTVGLQVAGFVRFRRLGHNTQSTIRTP